MRSRTHSMPRLLVPLSFFVVAVVVAEAALSPIGFGGTGSSLLLLSSTILYALTAAAFFATPVNSPSRVVALSGMATAATGLHVADPTGPVIGLFLVAALAPMTGNVVAGTVILVAAVLGYNAVQLGVGSEAVIITVATDAGCAFFYLFGTLLRSEKGQREAVSRLLQQLEASRHAEREANRSADRAALARELHDVLAHSISGLVIQLSGARLLAEKTGADPRLVDTLDRAHRLASSGLAEARRAVRMLREETLPDLDAIDRLLEEHTAATGTDVDWQQSGERPAVAAEVQLAVYRWAQETLSNVRKHAPHQVAHLHLAWEPDLAILEAWNAVGPHHHSTDPGSGYGLQGMAERAHNLGGHFEIEHSAHRFRTAMRLPLRRSGDEGGDTPHRSAVAPE